MAVWRAERLVTPQEACELLAEQFPQLRVNTIELLGSGWDNTAYLINDELVFRFPRRQIAVSLLETENKFLPTIQNILPMPIPNPKWIGKPSKSFEWPFSGYKLLKGKAACSANLSREERLNLAKPLAEFLRVLHDIEITQKIREVLKVGDIGKLNVERLEKRMNDYYQVVTDDTLDAYKSMMEKIVQDCRDAYEGTDLRVVQGDFYSRHILIGEDRQVSGIIDWGDVMIADPTEDISVAHSLLPVEAHQVFRQCYGQISDAAWRLARLRGAFYGIAMVAYAFDMKEPDILAEGMNTLDFVKEVM